MTRGALLGRLCIVALLTGCSGHAPPALPPAAGAPPEVASRPQSAAGAKTSVTIVVRIPRHAAPADAPRYVSPASKGMSVALSGPEKLNEAFGLTPGSDKHCQSSRSFITCTLTIQLNTGNYHANVEVFDRVPVHGRIPSSANLLSVAKGVPLHANAGTNQLKLTLDGVIALLAISDMPGGTIGTAFSAPAKFTVTATDADGYTIVGTYSNPVTLHDGDRSGATVVATSGADNPRAGELRSSGDAATVNYTGAPISAAAIVASASDARNASATFAPAPVLSSIGTASGTIGTSVSETLTGHFAPGATTVLVSGDGVTAMNVTAGTTSITASFFIDPESAVGSRNVTVQTSASVTSGAQTFTISNAGVVVVKSIGDTTLGTTPGLCPAGAAGELRYALCKAAAGDTIVFDTTAMCGFTLPCTIMLGAPLPPIVQNQTIDGGYFGRVIVDGATAYRAFWADKGTVTLANLQIQDAKARGGNGGSGGAGGGGGAGLGAALFVNAATVNVIDDYFLDSSAFGGTGGSGGVVAGDGGGGGLGGDGGSAIAGENGGSGGGGVLGIGAAPSAQNGGVGGVGGGGGGAGDASPGLGASGGAGYAGNSAGSTGGNGISVNAGLGASGGFGGGGGATGQGGNEGGNGGFGGGGGGGNSGGGGGPGGGSGAGRSSGGFLINGGRGGSGTTGNQTGGGGAAAGPAIFVYTGTLTTTNSGASGSIATAGNGGGGDAAAGTADATPVFNYSGTVNGSTTAGPISSALSNSVPH